MPELLLEILSEEIPARMQLKASEDLAHLLCEGLREARLGFENARTYVTPRRLVFVAENIPESTPDFCEERKGPAIDAPDKAIEGFLRSVGLSLDKCEKRKLKDREFWFAIMDRKGVAASEIITELISDALTAFPWPKSMRWAEHEFRWVRPLQGMTCIFGGEVLPIVLGATTAGGVTFGHRFLMPGAIAVSDFADYVNKLRIAKVVIDPSDRRDIIISKSTELALAEGLCVKLDEDLLDEVVGLVEWPVPLIGRIADKFMDLPSEVLTSAMRFHQRYFSCLDKNGEFANRFIVVANTEPIDGGEMVIAGNERVLNARLSDARFFWDTDRTVTLASRCEVLKDRVFHAKLGTLKEKVERIKAIAGDLAINVHGADSNKVQSASKLAKADLSTGMVGEFPELQGVMGRYYALNDGECMEVSDAIAEHYAPKGPYDICPDKPISICVSLADKIDTLVGFFGINEKPSGSKDPFALRRAALGVIRLIIENNLRLALFKIFVNAGKHYSGCAGFSSSSDNLIDFFAERLKVHLKDQGVRNDLIDAVFSVEKLGGGREDDLVRLLAKVDALKTFINTDDGANLLAAYKRAVNILRIEENKDKQIYDDRVDVAELEQEEEKALLSHLISLDASILLSLKDERFSESMSALATVRPLVDAFFSNVTVNCDKKGLRINRLNLLAFVRTTFDTVADFSRIEG